MKLIDMKNMEIVFAGEPWTHNILPCAKQAIPLLERNEKFVSWLRPLGFGVSQHIPAILYKEKFFSLSLRMQKAIYRHIRLKKGFKNEEVMDGVIKLRIPDVLLREKIRTQSRFDAMRKGMKQHQQQLTSGPSSTSDKSNLPPNSSDESQKDISSHVNNKKRTHSMMMMGESTNDPNNIDGEGSGVMTDKKDRVKNTCTVSARMRQVAEQMLTCDRELHHTALQQITIFTFKSHQNEILSCFLQDMRKENNLLYQNKAAFLQLVGDAYDQSQALFAS